MTTTNFVVNTCPRTLQLGHIIMVGVTLWMFTLDYYNTLANTKIVLRKSAASLKSTNDQHIYLIEWAPFPFPPLVRPTMPPSGILSNPLEQVRKYLILFSFIYKRKKINSMSLKRSLSFLFNLVTVSFTMIYRIRLLDNTRGRGRGQPSRLLNNIH